MNSKSSGIVVVLDQQVSVQVCLARVALGTVAVGEHVLLQVDAPRPTLAAHVAHVRPLACVTSDVHIEAGQRSEVLGAVGAAVGPLARVRAQVAIQTVACLKAFAALRKQEVTSAASAVAGTVRLEVCQRAERLGALVAVVRPTSVCALVDPQLRHT